MIEDVKNYKEMTNRLKKVATKYKIGIDFAIFDRGGDAYVFRPLEEFKPSESLRPITEKDEDNLQNCFHKLRETAEMFGFDLELIRLISNTGVKAAAGSFAGFKKYDEENNKISQH